MPDRASGDALYRVQEAIQTVQSAVYLYEGSLNKFLVDDKVCPVPAIAPCLHCWL